MFKQEVDKKLPTGPFMPPPTIGEFLAATLGFSPRSKVSQGIHGELIKLLEAKGVEPNLGHRIGPEEKRMELTLSRENGNPIISLSANIHYPGVPVEVVHFMVTPSFISAHYYEGSKTPQFLRNKDSEKIFRKEILPIIIGHYAGSEGA